MSRRQVPLEELKDKTVDGFGYNKSDEGEWAVIFFSDGYTLYVDEPVAYGPPVD